MVPGTPAGLVSDEERALFDSMPALGGMVREAYSGALAKKTKSSYDTGYRRYANWCEANGLEPLPVSESKLSFFVVYLALFVQMPSLQKYLSGIRSAQIDSLAYWPDTRQWLRFDRVLRFLKKKYGCEDGKPPRRPITTDLLAKMFATLDFNTHDDRLFAAASAMAVYSLWRGSEFLFSASAPVSQRLLLKDLSWATSGNRQCAAVRLSQTKTKWWRNDVVTKATEVGGATCPVQALQRYLFAPSSSLSASSFLFTLADGSPLSRPWMLEKTQRVLAAAGLSDSRFRSVSWRGGGALSARRAGISDSVIKALGRWQSNAFMYYLPVESADLAVAQSALARAKPPAARGRPAAVLGFSSASLFQGEDFDDLRVSGV